MSIVIATTARARFAVSALRAAMPFRMAELSTPYTEGWVNTTRSMPSVLCRSLRSASVE